MAQEDPFYIGWQEKAPAAYASKTRQYVWLALLAVLISAGAWVFGQQPFNGGWFEFGTITEIEGTLVSTPVPMLRVDRGRDARGQQIIQEILLVGFGKFSALPTFAAMEEEAGHSLVGTTVKLRGTLTYYDGKTVMELTEGAEAYISRGNESLAIGNGPVEKSGICIRGEIVDPKCFFGVMKPGEGKPHKSCAARCLSGGIPAIFKARSDSGMPRYFLLTDEGGNSINEDLIPYVADFLQVTGQTYRMYEWEILQIASTADLCPIGPKWLLADMPLCSDN